MLNKKQRELLKEVPVFDILDALMKEKIINIHNRSDVINHIDYKLVGV